MKMNQKLFFIGAKGEYNNMPFEILGNGQVDYTIKSVNNPEDSDDIGKSFLAIEHYCLANNGQTWYFAISDDEVYYCRQLNETEVFDLKQKINYTENNKETSQKVDLGKANLIESGVGKLKIAEGRAKRDFYDFGTFDYYDFKFENKSYSLDVFLDDKKEWFETIWIPQSQLTTIFLQSLRLDNPKVKSLIESSKIWQNLSIFGAILSILIFFVAIFLNFQKQVIFDQTKQISIQKGSEVAFDSIDIKDKNQLFSIKLSTKLPRDQGINLDIIFLDKNDKLIANTSEEFNSAQENSKTRFENLFYVKDPVFYRPIIKVVDYGKVGEIQEIPDKNSNSQEQIDLKLEIIKGGIIWQYWLFAIIICLAVSFICYQQKLLLNKKAWYV
jgi:hypothetical protein